MAVVTSKSTAVIMPTVVQALNSAAHNSIYSRRVGTARSLRDCQAGPRRFEVVFHGLFSLFKFPEAGPALLGMQDRVGGRDHPA